MIFCITGASSGIGEAVAERLSREPGAELVLVARREDRLQALAQRLPRTTYVAVDLVADDAPARIRAHIEEHHGGRLDVLVNNAGAAWRATFAQGGYANVRQTMELNFDAQVRLTEALLPLLRAAQPSVLVNVSSTSGRIARAGTGAYSASKFALAGWSDALAYEEQANGVHVALILPGFIATEGFPQKELPGFLVSQPSVAAEAIADAIAQRRPERYVPRYYWLFAALRIVAPRLVRRFVGNGQRLTTATHPGDPGDAKTG
jgi:short-subunit dehydrogenase